MIGRNDCARKSVCTEKSCDGCRNFCPLPPVPEEPPLSRNWKFLRRWGRAMSRAQQEWDRRWRHLGP